MKKRLLFVLLAFALFACNPSVNRDISEFYFPLSDFENERTYSYLIDNNSNIDTLSWVFKKSQIGQQEALISKSYSQKGIISHNTEVFNSNTSTYTRSVLFEFDDKGQVFQLSTQINPDKNIVFPFKVETDKSYSLEIQYNNPADNSLIKIERVREYDSTSKVDYKGQTIDCVIFTGKEVYSAPKQKFVFITEEYFAKNIGLVKSVKTGRRLKITTTLIDIK